MTSSLRIATRALLRTPEVAAKREHKHLGKMSSKKARKGKKMTKEEAASRKLLLEQEATKRRQELLDQFMKTKVGHEETRSRLNRIKLDRRWRELLRDEKCQELKVEIEITSRAFERVVDIKDRLISALTRDIVEAEQLQDQSCQSHLSKLENLLRIQESHLERLKANFDSELDTVAKRFETERNEMRQRHEKDMQDLKKLEAEVEDSFGEVRDAIIKEYQVLKDEQSDKSLAETRALHAHIDVLLDELRKQYRQTVDNYREETSEHSNSYRHLKDKDAINTQDIAANAKKIRSMTATLRQLEGRSEPNLKGEGDGMNKALKERNEMKMRFILLQSDLEKLQSVWDIRLMEMTCISNKVIRDLQRILLKGEQVVKLADLCKRHEKPEERASTLLPPLFRQNKFLARSAPIAQQQDIVTKLAEETDLFWGRRARAVVDKRFLLQRQQMLNLENEHLRTLLRNCLQDFSHCAKSDAEGLRYEVPDSGEGKKAAYCVIEASHIVKHMLF